MSQVPAKTIKRDEYGFRVEDFNEYRAKKYYTKPENEEKLVEELAKIEDGLKKYRYHDDLPRMSAILFHDYRAIEQFESNVFISLFFAFVGGSAWANQYYGKMVTRENIRNSRIAFGVISYALLGVYHYISPYWQPQNRNFFSFLTLEQRYKNALELKYDLYKNVELNKTVDFEKSPWEIKLEMLKYKMKQHEARKKITSDELRKSRGEA
eukprot:TRINITY_DN25711_c0_g1_i2.p1 TRINITY_DN25711_c0_g1~~TRINITY_DN25711_c0_g1_i2.p1  ORF type:complete len:210 (-),score=46.83 TRINITY_DN25711_c0_g1_i2:66-695(-)